MSQRNQQTATENNLTQRQSEILWCLIKKIEKKLKNIQHFYNILLEEDKFSIYLYLPALFFTTIINYHISIYIVFNNVA